MRPHEIEYPADEQIVAGVREHGSVSAYARKIGIPQQTLHVWIRKRDGLRALVDEARRQHKTDMRAPEDSGEQVSEVEILRQRNKELEAAAKQRRGTNVFEERIRLSLLEAVEQRQPVYSPRAIPKRQKIDEHEFVLLWSDLHAAEVVSREETNGINEYDWRIMLDRHDALRRGVLSYLENRPYPVRKLTVLGLGDMLSGNCHDELAETNEMPLAEATIQLGLDAAEWLDSFVPHFEEIAFAGVVGNHPRAHRKPRAKKQFDNADWTMYQTMQLRLQQSRSISFEIPKADAWPVTIAGRWRMLAFHGDGIRSSMPGVPWGGVSRRAAALQNQYSSAGLPIDLFACGHFHTANLVESAAGRIAMNGSVKGPDEYSLKQFGSGRHPQQALLTFHPRRGLTDFSLIDLEDREPLGVRVAQ